MILPWSHDSKQLRRRPWVTYLLMGACVAVHLATSGMGTSGPLQQAEETLFEAWIYWHEHPYLDPPERVVDLFGGLDEQTQAWLDEEFATEQGLVMVPAPVMEEEQAELDQMAARAEELLQDHAWFQYGLIASEPTARGAFGHLFLHGGWLHLLGNLWFLILAGPFIEDRLGRALYLGLYAASGLVGAGVFVLMHPEFSGPLVGASGAVSGVLGAFLVCQFRAKIRFLYWLGFFFGNFSAPAWLMLPLWFVGELSSAASDPSGAGGVAYWAHVGGFLFGAGAAFVLRKAGYEEKLSRSIGELDTVSDDPMAQAAREAIVNGDSDAAFGQLRQSLAEGPLEAEKVAAFLETARAAGLEAEAPGALAPRLGEAIEANAKDVALLVWPAVAAGAASLSMTPEQWLRLAGWVRETGVRSDLSQALMMALRGASAEQAIRIARAGRRADPVVVLRAARHGLSLEGLGSAEGQALRALAEEAEQEVRRRGIVVLPEGVTTERRRASGGVAEVGAFDDRAISLEPESEALDEPALNAPLGPGAGPDPLLEDADDGLMASLTDALEAEGLSEDDLLDEPLLEAGASLPPGNEFFGEAGEEGLAAPEEPAWNAEPLDPSPAEPAVEEAAWDPSLEEPPPIPVQEAIPFAEELPPPLPTEAPPPLPMEPPPLPVPEPAAAPSIPEDSYARTIAVPVDTSLGGLEAEFDFGAEEKEPELPPLRPLRLLEAVPLAMEDAHLVLDVSGRGRSRVAFERVEAVAVAGVKGLSASGKAVLVIDLVMNWTRGDDLQVVRLRSDAFDPRKLLGTQGSSLQAIRAFAARVRERSRAESLPAAAADDAPFHIFADVASYQAEVLRAEG
jgi:membrane associated rhomboid family serine protease